jgi:hypothetical protein
MIAEAAGDDSRIEDVLDEEKKQVGKPREKGLRWIPDKEDGHRPFAISAIEE